MHDTPKPMADDTNHARLQSPPLSPSGSSSSDSTAEHSTQDRPFACTYPGCTRRFRRKYTLKDHVNAHTGEKPFTCPVRGCGKSFTTSGNLARHKRLHPWLDTPLPCLVDGCGCEFPNDEKLQRHMLSHFGNSGEYRCEIGTCGRVFTTTGNLRRHIKQNHSDTLLESASPRSQQSPPPTQATHGLPAPLLYPSAAHLSTDHDILEALSCLFDDQDEKRR